VRLGGFAGWLGWLLIHIAFLTGYRNRIGAILTWWLAFTRDSRRERAFTVTQVGLVADVYDEFAPAGTGAGSAPGGAPGGAPSGARGRPPGGAPDQEKH
jgi:hypothetical protein